MKCSQCGRAVHKPHCGDPGCDWGWCTRCHLDIAPDGKTKPHESRSYGRK